MDELEKETGESFNQSQRHEWMVRYILERGSITIDELVERFKVSRMTIHRDLDDLEVQGVVRKIRNGATAQPSGLFESDIRYRLNKQKAEKEAIARVAASLIEPGQSILLDESTTILPLVRLLPDIGSLTVITNFLPILNALCDQNAIHVIALGGEYLPRYSTFTGALCEQALLDLQADIFFTSTTGVQGTQAFHPDQQILSVKRAMMSQATRRYLLLDHTKIGKTALHRIADLTAFDAVITDAGINERQLYEWRAAGVRVEVAPPLEIER
ncbi:DeoR family transcriptional regulator [Ktedonobacteria bacterium brp13]|nr:DeoR family transcriptional regulator [Ktedonobacteria bacterium brp13]